MQSETHARDNERILKREAWLLLLASPARCIKVFSIVLITGLTKLLLRPFDLCQRTNCTSSLLALSEKGVIRRVMI